MLPRFFHVLYKIDQKRIYLNIHIGMVNYLGQSDVRELVKAKTVLFSFMAGKLPFQYPGRRHCRDAHAVSQEHDHVLGHVLYTRLSDSVQDGRPGLVAPERWC